MYLFQLSYLFIDEAGSEIYIPLCIYFNHREDWRKVLIDKFTFHYVSISTEDYADFMED